MDWKAPFFFIFVSSPRFCGLVLQFLFFVLYSFLFLSKNLGTLIQMPKW